MLAWNRVELKVFAEMLNGHHDVVVAIKGLLEIIIIIIIIIIIRP
jgi:hypothetical protein